jgi:hypothetical protein
MYYYNKNNDKIKQEIYVFEQNYDAHLNNGENSLINLFKDSYRHNETFRDNIIDGEKINHENTKRAGLKEKIDI